MDDFERHLAEQMKDPAFCAEWESLQPALVVAQAMIDAREHSGMTQQQLAEKTGIAQGDISKLEKGFANPSVRTLQRLARGMGMTLKIEFQPNAAR